jgi:hypothetical protein
MVAERQERVVELLERLVNFNRQKLDEYYELSLDVQRNFGLNDYVDLHANFANECRNIGEKRDDIYRLPDDELAILEQALLETARIAGVNTSDINSEPDRETVRNYFPALDPNNPPGPYELLAAFGLLDGEDGGYRMILTQNGGTAADFNRVEQFGLGLFQMTGGIIGLAAFCASSGFAMIVGIVAARNIIQGAVKCATAVIGVEFRGTPAEAVRIIGRTYRWSSDLTEKAVRCTDVADAVISGGLNFRFTPQDVRRSIQVSGFLADVPGVIVSIRNILPFIFPSSSGTANVHTPTENNRRRLSIQERYDYYLNFDTSWGPGARIEKSMMKANLLRDIEELLLELNPDDSGYSETLEIMNRLLAE